MHLSSSFKDSVASGECFYRSTVFLRLSWSSFLTGSSTSDPPRCEGAGLRSPERGLSSSQLDADGKSGEVSRVQNLAETFTQTRLHETGASVAAEGGSAVGPSLQGRLVST